MLIFSNAAFFLNFFLTNPRLFKKGPSQKGTNLFHERLRIGKNFQFPQFSSLIPTQMNLPTQKWLIATLILYCWLPALGQFSSFRIYPKMNGDVLSTLMIDRLIEQRHPVVTYVAEGKNGNGSSWEEASGNLQEAILSAKQGSQIWVASGTYYPTTDNDRNAAFNIRESVSLYGGFSGNEQSFDERDPSCHPTILSGEIGTASRDDNSYTIVYSKNISLQTVIDGFVIRGGNANGIERHISPKNNGAGWFNMNASPTINNCVFSNNTARKGAAIYNHASKGEWVSPTISNCSFSNNRADLDGGAIFNSSNFGSCMPEIENCLFQNNLATYGAGIMNEARGGITKATISRCKFINNRSLIKGGGIYNHCPYLGMSVANTYNCTYQNNLASIGSDVSSYRLPGNR